MNIQILCRGNPDLLNMRAPFKNEVLMEAWSTAKLPCLVACVEEIDFYTFFFSQPTPHLGFATISGKVHSATKSIDTKTVVRLK